MLRRLLLSLAFLALAACDEPDPLVFRYQIAAAPVTLDPGGSGDVFSSGIKLRIFDGLISIDPHTGHPIPDLAESWEVSDDGLIYTFHLLPESVFHHGRPVRAEDVQASWERFLAPERDPDMAHVFEALAGVAEFRARESEHISGIEVVDPLTIRVQLERASPSFLYNLGHDVATIVPIDEVERLGESFGRNPVGSGPFRFISWDEEITLAAFPDHPRTPPGIDRLVYVPISDSDEALRLYQADDLDLVSTLPVGRLESIRQSYGEDLRFSPSTSWFGFCFRCDRPPFDDVRVRRAFGLAIDRDALVQQLGEMQYTASTSLLPQNTAGFDPKMLSSGYDPEKARALLSEAGFLPEEMLPVLYTTRPGTLDAQVARRMRDDFAVLGIDMQIEENDFGELLDRRRRGDLALFRFGWGGEYPSVDSNLRPLFHSRGADNRVAYFSDEFDQLLDAALYEEDAEHRIDLAQRAEQRLIEDAPCVGLYQVSDAILLKPRWTGLAIDSPEGLKIESVRLH